MLRDTTVIRLNIQIFYVLARVSVFLQNLYDYFTSWKNIGYHRKQEKKEKKGEKKENIYRKVTRSNKYEEEKRVVF